MVIQLVVKPPIEKHDSQIGSFFQVEVHIKTCLNRHHLDSIIWLDLLNMCPMDDDDEPFEA